MKSKNYDDIPNLHALLRNRRIKRGTFSQCEGNSDGAIQMVVVKRHWWNGSPRHSLCSFLAMTIKEIPSLRAANGNAAIPLVSDMSCHYVNGRRLSQYEAASTNGGLLRHGIPRNDRRTVACLAFTMAEILLSLTIIGVVAAITLPSLTGNINERTWNTQRKALYARMSQAIPLMGAINGYQNSETFVSSGLSKVLKINNICDETHLADCGIASKFTTLNANTYTYSLPWKLSDYNTLMTSYSYASGATTISHSLTDSNAIGFETANGESIALFYMPGCQPYMGELENTTPESYLIQPKICINMVYDLNGQKGPNSIGKDVGVMSVLYSTDSVIAAPFPYLRSTPNADFNTALRTCKDTDENLRLPNLDELAAMFVNSALIDITSYTEDSSGGTWGLWSSKPASSLSAWDQSFVSGLRRPMPKTETKKIRCVYR